MNMHNLYIIKQVNNRTQHSKRHVELCKNCAIYAFTDPMHHLPYTPTSSKQKLQSQCLDSI